MIPAAFEYERVDTVDAALAALAAHGDEAKLLAGGHSLLPLLKLRLAEPGVLVDIGPVRALSYIRDDGDAISIGSLTRHRDLETSDTLAAHAPLLRAAAHQVGDPQVRHRGTIGGSVAHGDPASDLPATLLALGATMLVRGPAGERRVDADDFFVGFLETALSPDELLVEISVPKATGAGWSFQKFNRRAQDWAIVGVACQATPTGARIGLVNMGSTPLRARGTEHAVGSGATIPDAAAVAHEGTAPTSDLGGSAEYREHLCRVLVRRALTQATAPA
ncbi:MAG: xanthine dehydrogenase family protein subunit M [Acidimicrobiales bacterium]|nr:xanthine dehydrogenase family protein subunit M [Acidimicrobiales bacterium]